MQNQQMVNPIQRRGVHCGQKKRQHGSCKRSASKLCDKKDIDGHQPKHVYPNLQLFKKRKKKCILQCHITLCLN